MPYSVDASSKNTFTKNISERLVSENSIEIYIIEISPRKH